MSNAILLEKKFIKEGILLRLQTKDKHPVVFISSKYTTMVKQQLEHLESIEEISISHKLGYCPRDAKSNIVSVCRPRAQTKFDNLPLEKDLENPMTIYLFSEGDNCITCWDTTYAIKNLLTENEWLLAEL